MITFFALILPLLFWPQPPDSAPQLRKAGVHRIAVPQADAPQWAAIPGISIEPVDITSCVKLPAPSLALRVDEASASRVPWLTSNGWRFLRRPNARYDYDAPGAAAPLAAAEAFAFAGNALIHVNPDALAPVASILKFLASLDSAPSTAIADIGYVDDGSPASAEVMNLMIRDNLLFAVAPAHAAGFKLLVHPGSDDYPKFVKDADAVVHRIRAELGDPKRSVRLYGTSVVVARLTGEPGHLRLHLLNYGAAARTRVQAFRVRVLGRYSTARLHALDNPDEKLLDYEALSDATEFTVPELKLYAAVDLVP